ncbi:MAG TPA: phospholipid carrier-dependent glycosyltransferase [Actinomycetota bacterium]|nr:phospholipid carrier-dependent glycosyltransferase [Actinomycetota bacterium]
MRTPRTAALVIAAITLLAGVTRFVGLGRPDRKVFDEVYYASDGCWYAGIDYRACGLEADVERSWVHPPLGKQLIALGIDAFGNRPLGWRAASAVAGAVTVALVGFLGFLLFGSALWAGLAALLASTEHLLFVQSRIAMLDIFLAMFVVLGFTLLVADRRRADREVERGHGSASLGGRWRPLLLLSGASFGAAMAVKWSGVLALVGAALLAVAWARTRAARSESPLAMALRREGPILYLGLLVMPLLAYSATWIPWLADRGFDLVEWVRHHGDMAGYHVTLDTVGEDGKPIHPYMSAAWTWFFLLRPVAYFWRGDPSCCAEILGIGSPALFWGALVFVPYLAISWRMRRDWRAGAILVPVLSQFLPWLLVTRPLFLFYMTPVAPFLALGAVYAIRDVAEAPVARWITAPAAVVLAAVAVGVFVFFWPVLTGDTISQQAWWDRIWFYRGEGRLPNWV